VSRVMACGPARPAWQAIAPYPNRTRQRCNWKPTATRRQIIPFWEWPTVLAPSASPQGRGLEAHSCHASPSPSLALPLPLYLPISFAPSRLLAGCPSLGSNSGNSPHPAPWSHAVSWERMPPPRGPCTTLAPYAAELAATECHGPCESRAPCGFVQGGARKYAFGLSNPISSIKQVYEHRKHCASGAGAELLQCFQASLHVRVACGLAARMRPPLGALGYSLVSPGDGVCVQWCAAALARRLPQATHAAPRGPCGIWAPWGP